MFKKILLYGGLAILALIVLIQLVPFGRNHTNPPVVQEPAWDSPETRALAVRACFDYHSNETNWKWYTNIAPFSWLIQRDVDEGRERLNFLEWGMAGSGEEGEGGEGGERGEGAEEAGEVILEGEMLPAQYLLMHPEAHLTDAEKQALVQGLANSLR
jgi:hypothetical protein